MTKEDIIRMAEEAAKDYTQTFRWEYMLQIDKDIFERFAALVAAHEREECAKLCEELGKNYWEFSISRNAAETCAKYIRKRGEQ